jgi:hypothetical protein
MYLKIKKIIGVCAAVMLIAAWFTYGFLENTYIGYPRTPDQEVGRTIPYAAKGVVVYITASEQQFLSWLKWIEIASGGVAALVLLVHGGDPFRAKK